MHYYKINLLFVAICLGATSFGQTGTGVHNMADAYGYNPSHDHQEENFTFEQWAGHTSLTATSTHHPFDPPNNTCAAFSEFLQPELKDATVRGMSFVYSDYSGSGSNITYKANTSFSAHQVLKVEFGNGLLGTFHLFLGVPMHGFMAAQSSPVGNSESNALATLFASVDGNAHSASTLGILTMHATNNTNAAWQASGDWGQSDVFDAAVTLPTNYPPRVVDGVGLNTNALLDLGLCDRSDPNIFDVHYDFTTSAENQSPNGSFALADFSGTGHMAFRMFDSQGNEVTDFTVTPVFGSVPEPTTIAALALGLGILVSRRRKQK